MVASAEAAAAEVVAAEVAAAEAAAAKALRVQAAASEALVFKPSKAPPRFCDVDARVLAQQGAGRWSFTRELLMCPVVPRTCCHFPM